MDRTGLFIILAALLLEAAFAATTYSVGDDMAWGVPRNISFYEGWSTNKTFQIGDSLEFKWAGVHNVLEVKSKSEYDNCTKSNGILKEMSPVTIPLTQNTTLFFICTIGPHCSLGQKVAIKVGNGVMPSSSPPPSPANSVNPRCSISDSLAAFSATLIFFFIYST
ncbi:umecyanin-like [Mercurialis annua]|uniref:umecyanin-like n=1 Tax=Mercurialis annua TaxID=3986 RepID=UPI00215E8E3B|nr:umecyanin-like [Mercurialis annua]